jgi:hypothetical protein
MQTRAGAAPRRVNAAVSGAFSSFSLEAGCRTLRQTRRILISALQKCLALSTGHIGLFDIVDAHARDSDNNVWEMSHPHGFVGGSDS